MKIDTDDKILLKAFGESLAKVRKSCSLTQQELATRAGVSRSLIISVETGRRWPHLTLLHQIAENGLNMRLYDLFNRVTWPEGYS